MSMIIQTEAIIHLASQRSPSPGGMTTTTQSCRINDTYLTGGTTYATRLLKRQSMLIVPYIGDVELKRGHESLLIEEHQLACFEAKAGELIELTNPYPNEAINFFEVLIEAYSFEHTTTLLDAKVQAQPNELLRPSPILAIGQFTGRREGTFQPQSPNGSVLVYCIAGAFEVQNRLLEARDALTLWHVTEIEFEALSNDALLLLIELP
jgi:quercetin 2,3-dioxygenase